MSSASSAEPWTILRLLGWTTDFLRKHGADNPRLDAEVLLAHALGCERIELYTAFGEEPPEAARARFRELVKRRADGAPVAYLVGHKEFYSLEFVVTPAVLTPRAETEHVVVILLDLAKQRGPRSASPAPAPAPAAADAAAPAPLEIADVGAGSGVLAVCAAKHLPGARVTAIDISPPALAVARRNADAHGVADRVTFLESDLLTALPAQPRFDFIVSNPPYVASGDIAGLPRDVRDHEPRVALDGGPTGAEVVARLVEQAAARLRPGGWLVFEISPLIESATRDLLAADGRYTAIQATKDLAGLTRVFQARRAA